MPEKNYAERNLAGGGELVIRIWDLGVREDKTLNPKS